ncbi:MAG: proline dehydrogenase family protein, partial [Nitrospiraceae bacterium]
MKLTDSVLEPAIRRIGHELRERSAGSSPTVFDPRWWSGNLLEWCMKDETFKVQLFRFIDVLPCLRDDAHVARLLEEYFRERETLAPSLQWGLRAMSATRLGARLSAKSLRHQIHQMARTFIADASIERAVPVLARLWTEGRGFSVDLLGEATVSEQEADRYRDRCLEALRLLAKATAAWPSLPVLERDRFGPLPRVNLSVKLSALYSQLDPVDPEGCFRAVAARLRPMLDLAATLPAAITFDMEQAELKDLTLMTFMRLLSEDAYRRYPHGGLAMQAYLKESAADLQNVIRWVRQRGTPVTIRLVKGAYWDSDTIRYQQRGWPVPVFETKAETDHNYELLSRTLVEHASLIRPAFGTHNLRTLAHAQAAAEAAGLPPDAAEYQMIFGMAEPLQAAVTQAGRRVRIYTPVGELLPGMAYLVRRLLENTSNESFLRKEYTESQPLDLLLAPPPVPTPPASGRISQGPSEPELTDRFINEPHTDFSKTPARAAMAQAITSVRAQFGRRLPYPVAPGLSPSGSDLVSRNPSSPGDVVGRMPGFAPQDIAVAARHALSRQPVWKALSPALRADIMSKAAAAMRQRRFELSAWEMFETGKPWHEADADVAE